MFKCEYCEYETKESTNLDHYEISFEDSRGVSHDGESEDYACPECGERLTELKEREK